MPPRVVYFELPGYIGPDYVEDEACPVYQALQVTVHTLGRDGETVTTERMSADDPRAAAFRGDPTIEHDVSADYAFWTTTSPASLDLFDTLSLGERNGLRLVAIRRDYSGRQIARYENAFPALEAA